MGMNVLSYHRTAAPLVIADAFKSFVKASPIMEAMMKSGTMKALTGTNVKINFIQRRHSSPTPLDASTNWTIEVKGSPIYNTGSFDWGEYGQSLQHLLADQNRYTNPADWAAQINDTNTLTTALLLRDVLTWILLGTCSADGGVGFSKIGTLNGAATSLTSSGLTTGALQHSATPSGTYLNRTRKKDTRDFVDNWFSHYVEHNGFAVDFFRLVEDALNVARHYQAIGGLAKPNKAPTVGIMPLSNLSKFSEALRLYPGTGQPSLVTTIAEYKKGDAVPISYHWNGITFEGDYVWDYLGANVSLAPAKEPVMILDPASMQFYMQKGHDLSVSPLTDMSPFGIMKMVAFLRLSMQFVCSNPMANILAKKA